MTTLSVLAELEREMTSAGRVAEGEALRDARLALARPERGVLSTGQAADRLGVSIPTVKRWVERGTLSGRAVGGRWAISQESVDRLVRLRAVLDEVDAEGNPTPDEVASLYRRERRTPRRVAEA
jgi:excisionase family DNA binding protein